jgi:spore maturation protein CgeB
MNLDIVFFGLSITSSWGNGHASTYRALIKALHQRGHRITFLERDVAWYRPHRDLLESPYCRTELYENLRDVPHRYSSLVSKADFVIVGSYVPDGKVLADWVTMHARGVTAFYDIDTPVTLAALEADRAEYISAALIPRFDLYLSFTGGPVLEFIENRYGSPRARTLHCGVDPQLHRPIEVPPRWSLGYLGTYSEDRQDALQRLLVDPARELADQRFVVAGASYPASTPWPPNVERIEHLAPSLHSQFYRGQRYTLNVTRSNMVRSGFSPSVRLFEAAACGTPIISDRWRGIDTVFAPGKEILVVDTPEQVVTLLREFPEERRLQLAEAGRRRVLTDHTSDRRAHQLERYYEEAAARISTNVSACTRTLTPRRRRQVASTSVG